MSKWYISSMELDENLTKQEEDEAIFKLLDRDPLEANYMLLTEDRRNTTAESYDFPEFIYVRTFDMKRRLYLFKAKPWLQLPEDLIVKFGLSPLDFTGKLDFKELLSTLEQRHSSLVYVLEHYSY